MVETTTDHTVELSPLDLLRYVEGYRQHTVLRLSDGLLCLEFAYNISCDYEQESGTGNYEMAPVLNTRALKTVIGSGVVRYEHVGSGERFFVLMDEDERYESIIDELKVAFNVHGRGESDVTEGMDPRRVWAEYTDGHASVPKSKHYGNE